MTDTNTNLFGEKVESDTPKQRKTSAKKQTLNCRDKLLAEYKADGFEPFQSLKNLKTERAAFFR